MKIPAGAPGWCAACTPDERAATAALAASRGKWSAVWAALAALGVLCAGGVLVTGLLPVPWSAGAVSRGALAVGLCALVLDLGVLVPNCMAWSRVGRVFSGTAPDEVVRPFRWLRWVPAPLVSLFGTVAMLLVGAQPLAVLGAEGIRDAGATVWLTAAVAVLCVLCGLSTLWLKVILRPVRTVP